jgi:serine/threonine-protein kinase
MKPENVMLVDRDGDPDFVKVLDFGIAKLDSGTGAYEILTQAGALIGTPEYMSPEQALGQTVDARSDLYSVGVILFELLTGRCPFGGGLGTLLRQHVAAEAPELPADAMASFDPAIGSILRRLLARDPASRFGSAAEVMALLDGWSRVRVLPAVTAPRALLWHLPRKGLVVAAIAVAAAAAVILMASAGTKTQAAATTTTTTSATSALTAAPSATLVPVQLSSPSPPLVGDASPPASPSSIADKPAHRHSVARPASLHEPQKAPSRRVGPGGIYIPPPSEWFH